MTKKEKIELTARELFWKHGFKKVSIEEICRKSHVSRKTYYTYFQNKSDLVVFILNGLTDEMLKVYQELIESNLPFAEKIEKLLDKKFEMTKSFSKEFVSDFFHPDAVEVMKYFTDIVNESFRLTKLFFTDAQLKGEMNPDLNIDFVMWMMQKQMELTASPEISTIFTDVETMTRQLSELIIYGIMPTNK